MQLSTAENLRAVAPQILSGQYTADTPFCPEVVKRAIAILEILKDGNWHTAAAISNQLGIGSKYTRDILRVCAEAWGLEAHRRNGFRSPLHFCPACKRLYYPEDGGDHFYHECDRCSWHWAEKRQN